MSETESNPEAKAFYGALLSFPLFEGFTEFGIARMVDTGEVVHCEAGELLCEEGDPAGDVVLVVSGTLEVFVVRDGKDFSIANIAPGKILGEISLLSELPRTASVRTKEAVQLLKWSGDAFRRLLFGDAGFARRVFRDSLRSIVDGEKKLIEERTQQA